MIEDDELKADWPDDLMTQAMGKSWELVKLMVLLRLKAPIAGREWAIAATDAEKLHSWICYAVTVGQSIMEDDA